MYICMYVMYVSRRSNATGAQQRHLRCLGRRAMDHAKYCANRSRQTFVPLSYALCSV